MNWAFVVRGVAVAVVPEVVDVDADVDFMGWVRARKEREVEVESG